MPFWLCRPLGTNRAGLWGEGAPYTQSPIYQAKPDQPPVFYDRHHLALHSFCHVESLKHVDPSGAAVDRWGGDDSRELFWGSATVVKIQNPAWEQVGSGILYRVTVKDLEMSWSRMGLRKAPCRMFIAPENYPVDEAAYHRSDAAFVLSESACAYWLRGLARPLLGTSYRSIDFEPGSRLRPIHQMVLKNGAAMELLDLQSVPEGQYILASQPIPLVGASETLVAPVLWTRDEWIELAQQLD
jgi:arylformamidase